MLYVVIWVGCNLEFYMSLSHSKILIITLKIEFLARGSNGSRNLLVKVVHVSLEVLLSFLRSQVKWESSVVSNYLCLLSSEP